MDKGLESKRPNRTDIKPQSSRKFTKRNLEHARPGSYYKNRMRNRAALIAAGVVAATGLVVGIAELANKERIIPNADQVYDGTIRVSREHVNRRGERIELNIRTSPSIPQGSNATDNTIDWPYKEDVVYVSNPKIVKFAYDPVTGEEISQAAWVEFDLPQGEAYASWSAATHPLIEVVEPGEFINGAEAPDGGFKTRSGDTFKPNELSIVSFNPPATTFP